MRSSADPEPFAPCYISVAYTHEATDPRVRRHSETMVRRGWRVYQLGLAGSAEPGVGRLDGVVLVRWRRRRYRGGALFRYALAYLGFLLWARRMVRRIARHRQVNVVHVNNLPNFMVLAAGPARRRGAGVVLDIHDPEPELFLSKFGRRPGAALGAGLLTLEERWAAARADVVLCVQDAHRDATAAHGIDTRKLRVVINSPDGRLFPLLPPRRSSMFVAYHGTLTARAGLEVVLEALSLLRARGLDVRGALWGDGDAVDRLLRTRARLGLDDAIELPGTRLRVEDLLPRLAEVGIGLVPVARDRFMDLTLPTKMLEYVRLGIPVVAVWTPTLARYFPEDTVWFVRDLSAAILAAALEQVLAAPEEARERAARAQRLAIARGWNEFEESFVDLMSEIGRVEHRGRAADQRG